MLLRPRIWNEKKEGKTSQSNLDLETFSSRRESSFFLSLGRKRDERLRDDNGCRQKDEGRRGKEE